MKFYILIFYILYISLQARSQTVGNIVHDDEGKLLSFSKISISNKVNTSIKGAASDELGTSQFEDLTSGSSLSATAQTKKDTLPTPLKFSGTLVLITNGISPIPAFSLEKPAVLGNLSIQKNRFSYNPEMAFSTKGIPWYLNNIFRYRLIEKTRFQFQTGLISGIGYSYPEERKNGISQSIAKAERFFWLELVPKYKISKKVEISSTTYIGYNFEPGSVKRINYISLIGNITKIKLYDSFYSSFFPQIFYLNIDNISDGFFVAGILGVGHLKIPMFLSTQVNQTITTNIIPNPGFKWNVNLSYTFK